MSLKKDLLESENFRCIHLFDTNELSMRDECMLSYLIELADYKKCDYRQMEITAKYIQIRKPNWKDRDIKESLKSLCKLGYINFEGTHGRGNCYTLNIDFIKEKLLESNIHLEESEKPTLKSYEYDIKNLTKECSTLKDEKNTNIYKAADPAPKKYPGNSKGYKALMEYIDATTYSFETKEELKKWYDEVGKGRLSVNQLRDKLKDLYEQVGGDEVKARETIHRSYINSYMAFYPVKSNNSFNNFGKIDTIHTSHKVDEPQKKVKRIVI